jgi:hypothetical protein
LEYFFKNLEKIQDSLKCDKSNGYFVRNLRTVLKVSRSVLVVGIATVYELDGPGIEFRWGRDFPYMSRPALRPTQPPVK